MIYYLTEIGLYYLQSRYYDASVGRFINADTPSIITINKTTSISNIFCYCYNDCINANDYTGAVTAQLTAKIILGIMLGCLVQLISDIIGYWLATLYGKGDTYTPSGGDYLASMLSWALTCVSFNDKTLEMCAMVLPVIIKQLGRIFNKSFDWIDFAIDIAIVLISYILNKCLSTKKKNDLNKIKKKAGNGNNAYNTIRIKEKRLNIKISKWGVRINFGINISTFCISCIYNLITSAWR